METNLPCPDCNGPTIPPVVLERWQCRRILQCLNCYGIYYADTKPTGHDGLWQATLSAHREDYPFDLRK
jgi:hypothetical protein